MMDGAMMGRIADFIASWKDPNGYYLRGKTVVKVIDEIDDVPETVKQSVKDLLGISEVKDDTLVDSLQLGIKLGTIYRETKWEAEKALVMRFANEIRDLNKVPYVNIGWESIM